MKDVDIRQEFEDYSFDVVGKLFNECEGNLDNLSQKEREVVYIWRLEADMYNGGFIQYFCNWGYENFKNTVKTLKKIGAKKSLEIITECENLISKLKDDKRIKELWDIPKFLEEYLSKEEIERLNELDKIYWEDLDDIQKLGYENYLK